MHARVEGQRRAVHQQPEAVRAREQMVGEERAHVAGGAGDENLHPGSEVPRDELRPAADMDGPEMDDERGLADHLIAARLGGAAISVSSCSAAHLTAMARWRALEIA